MSSDDESISDKECPLCMEPFDFDDVNFYPCTCQYQICRFCWHRLKTDENGLCPACRQPYPENPVNYQPVSGTELQKFKSKSKTANKTGKVKPADSRKHLGNYRVLQKNLVYVVGLSQKLADVEVLKRPEFFGRFGKILKVVVGTTSILNSAGQQTSCTAYVTYARDDDALRAIEAVNNAVLDGRLLKASLGTTKYCSTFLRGQTCHKATGGKMDCMYLHKIAEPDASFTKEDMHAGKHTEFERRLHEELAARSDPAAPKKQIINGEKLSDAKKSDNETASVETENASESETNSSELDNRASVEPSDPASFVDEHIMQHGLQRPPSEPIPLPTFMGLRQTTPPSPPLHIPQQSIPNKFTTCEEFERMLIMESSKQTEPEPDPTINATATTNQCNGNDNSYTNHLDFDDDLGFDPFSESIKGLADLVIEEQECRKQLQQQQQMPNFGLPFRPQPLRQQPIQPIQRPIGIEPARLYNSYLHQNTYVRYNQFRELAKQALNPAGNWPVGPPPGLNIGISPTASINNGFFSQK